MKYNIGFENTISLIYSTGTIEKETSPLARPYGLDKK